MRSKMQQFLLLLGVCFAGNLGEVCCLSITGNSLCKKRKEGSKEVDNQQQPQQQQNQQQQHQEAQEIREVSQRLKDFTKRLLQGSKSLKEKLTSSGTMDGFSQDGAIRQKSQSMFVEPRQKLLADLESFDSRVNALLEEKPVGDRRETPVDGLKVVAGLFLDFSRLQKEADQLRDETIYELFKTQLALIKTELGSFSLKLQSERRDLVETLSLAPSLQGSADPYLQRYESWVAEWKAFDSDATDFLAKGLIGKGRKDCSGYSKGLVEVGVNLKNRLAPLREEQDKTMKELIQAWSAMRGKNGLA